MIVIAGRFARYGEIWFDEQPQPRVSVDVLLFRQRSSPLEGYACEPFLSLVQDLSASPEQIMRAFGQTNRYKIKRAGSKDGLSRTSFDEPREHVEEFIAFYDAFAREKSLEPAYRRSLYAACAARQLVLSHVAHQERKLVWHAYIKSGDKIGLLHSASLFRNAFEGDRALIGRANRWLHWQDILAFQKSGYRVYDWGGLFVDESKPQNANVNSFKREFGGTPVRTYNCSTALTLRGRAYLAIRQLRLRSHSTNSAAAMHAG
jgi:hypothetical protein